MAPYMSVQDQIDQRMQRAGYQCPGSPDAIRREISKLVDAHADPNWRSYECGRWLKEY